MPSIVEQAARAAWKPPADVPIWEWAEANIVVRGGHSPGPYRVVNSPWMRSIMADFQDSSVQTISVMCCARGSKTLTSMLCLLWSVAEDPGACAWVMDSGQQAEYFAEENLWPVMESSPAISALLPADRTKRKKLHISFAAAPLSLTGAGGSTGGQAKSKSLRRLVLDECDLYESLVPSFETRAAEFWNRKIVFIGTPCRWNGVSHTNYIKGNQCVWYFPCEACGHEQELVWSGQREDKTRFAMCWDEAKDAAGNWDVDAASASCRYVCVKCGHAHRDVPTTRKHIALKGHWYAKNPGCDKTRRSYSFPCLLPPYLEWSLAVKKWLEANIAKKQGNLRPLEQFFNDNLGLPWSALDDEKPAYSIQTTDYVPKEKWEHEVTRFLTCDVQRFDVRYWVVRAWALDGRSRLVACGRTDAGWEAIRAKQLEFGVEDKRTWIDSGNWAKEVYGICSRFGWQTMKGDDQDYFPTKDERTGEVIRRIYRRAKDDPFVGSSTNLYLFSRPSTLEAIELFIQGKALEWQVPPHVNEEYAASLTCFRRMPDDTKKGWHWHEQKSINHFLACERMMLVAAILDPFLSIGKSMSKPMAETVAV